MSGVLIELTRAIRIKFFFSICIFLIIFGIIAIPAPAAGQSSYPQSFEAEGSFEKVVSPHRIAVMTFKNHIKIKVANGKVSGAMTSAASGGAFSTSGGGAGEFLLEGAYDPAEGALSGTFKGGGSAGASNPMASGAGSGTASGTWKASTVLGKFMHTF